MENATRAEPNTDATRSAEALAFARRAHAGQRRKQTGEDFVEHPIAVARLLGDAGYGGDLVVAAYLHDAVEKGPVGIDEVRSRFGEHVADVVGALTEDHSLPGYAERKRALRRQVLAAGEDPVLIYAADRVTNLRDWRRAEPGRRPAIAESLGTTLQERLELWAEDLQELTRHRAELPFLAEIELDLRELRSQAGAGAGAGSP
ncbi:MAG: bifunctional (p)ppGpp synthetase/guanosine-3',5'-bis(diphosphate) 3'-pyrophosphohydrolase [Actinobacteria bacterium]|nr:bifunctional (p)ppGpp synthetase/guanosine-3',5'-bis(diphosphate) 3'-pyrophosphohydrolase [Actinomycetota bacterium]